MGSMTTESRRGAIGKYNAGTVRVIIEALELGMTQRAACNVANIDPATFYDWMERHDDFSSAVNMARDRGKQEALQRIREAAREPKHWQAAAWYLERSFPQEYGQRRIHEFDRESAAQTLREIAAEYGVLPTDEEIRLTLNNVEYKLLGDKRS